MRVLREPETVLLLGTLNSLAMPTHHIQSNEFASQCFRDKFNRTIFDLLELGDCEIGVMERLRPVVFSIKSLGLFEIGHAHLAQMSWAFFLVAGPICCLADWATIRSSFAGTAFVGARLIAAGIRAGGHSDLI